jgi:hypothetical protein
LSKSKNVIFVILGTCIILLLSGCAAFGDKYSSKNKHAEAYEAFISGDITFSCSLACSGNWGANRSKLKELYTNGQWRELAMRVVNIGFNWQLSYFYLGRAAEELGYPSAAKYYYSTGQNAFKCNTALIDNCDGFDLPAVFDLHLATLGNSTSTVNTNNELPVNPSLPPYGTQDVSSSTFLQPEVNFKGDTLSQRRIALVIGNSRYQYLPGLDNPRNDSELLAATLRKIGFTLIGDKALLDLDKTELEKAIRDFSDNLQQDQSYQNRSERKANSLIALFYYAGHGIQARGDNFLIPVNANPTKESDLDFQLINVNLVLRQMESATTSLNMVILDACRNNPIGGRGLRGGGSGLAEMKPPEGTLIAFATQSGNVAQDGPSGGNSPFAQSLAWGIQQPGMNQFDVFNAVAVRVKKQTRGMQQPWMSNSPIEGQFIFVPK